MAFKKRNIIRWLSYWPPYLGAGVSVRRVSPDFLEIDVEMKLRPWNRNYFGTHFGGSLYSMCDPFLVLMMVENLGPGYVVWDKAACIRFKKPGRGTVRAEFRLTREEVEAVRARVEVEPKVEPVYVVNVYDAEGSVIAEVEKTLYVRRKEGKQ
jgi:acyl-coenzyme A thioesterase PaaI-like protein